MYVLRNCLPTTLSYMLLCAPCSYVEQKVIRHQFLLVKQSQMQSAVVGYYHNSHAIAVPWSFHARHGVYYSWYSPQLDKTTATLLSQNFA